MQYKNKTHHEQGRGNVYIMFQMTVDHPACSWIYHTPLKDFAITIKI